MSPSIRSRARFNSVASRWKAHSFRFTRRARPKAFRLRERQWRKTVHSLSPHTTATTAHPKAITSSPSSGTDRCASGNELVGGPNVLPAKYASAKTSDVQIRVAAGENQLNPIQITLSQHQVADFSENSATNQPVRQSLTLPKEETHVPET